MRTRRSSSLSLAAGLMVASLLLALAHWYVFRDARTLGFYLFVDLVFLPTQVLLVSLVIEGMLRRRDRRVLLNRLNLAIGVFFGEMGAGLLRLLYSPAASGKPADWVPSPSIEWTAAHWERARRALRQDQMSIAPSRAELAGIREYLESRHAVLLSLLQNPNLLEHDAFTECLWAIAHLDAELSARRDLAAVPDSDLEHLQRDASRAFAGLAGQWFSYMAHLAEEYPYMHSLAVRTNPFAPESSPEVR